MNITVVARRYAGALADVALETGAQDKVREDLGALTAALRTSAELDNAIKSPAVPQEKKIAVLEALWKASGRSMQPLCRNLILLLIRNNRLGLVEQIEAAYTAALHERQGVVTAEIVTRFEVREELKSLLVNRLSEVTGKKVQMNYSTDESVIGGVMLRIGSTIYDASIRRQLLEIRQRLTGN